MYNQLCNPTTVIFSLTGQQYFNTFTIHPVPAHRPNRSKKKFFDSSKDKRPPCCTKTYEDFEITFVSFVKTVQKLKYKAVAIYTISRIDYLPAEHKNVSYKLVPVRFARPPVACLSSRTITQLS